MQIVFAVAGTAVLLLLFADALATTLGARAGAGPVTGGLARCMWRILLRVHRSREGGSWLHYAGPGLLILALAVWMVMLWAGWTLVFLAGDPSVSHATTGAPGQFWQVVYYVGFCIFTLGLGDYSATSEVWRVLSTVAAFSGLFLVTLAITYLLSVLSAVVQRRAAALQISSLGQDPVSILRGGWGGTGFTPTFLQQLNNLSSPLATVAQQHLAYPVLAFFHSGQPQTSLPTSVADLDEAMLMLQHGVVDSARPSDVPQGLRTVVGRLLSTSSTAELGGSDLEPPSPDLDELRRAGLPVRSDEAFAHALRETASRRRQLRQLVEGSGHRWPAPR